MNPASELLTDSPHSTQFQELTRRLLLIFSSAGVIPRMPAEEIDHYASLSLFHDIGKQAIPPDILNKPGSLTPEEFAIMKTHTIEGCRLLEARPELASREDFPLICDVCRHHHERWDGGGYPDRLPGCRIAPWVQVVGLADAFDALIHPRVYTPAYPQAQAASMIAAGACGSFAPEMLDCFSRCISSVYIMVYTGTFLPEKQEVTP